MTESIVEKQIGILRAILSDIAENDKNGSENFIGFTNKYFCFDTQFGWNILMNAFYVFEDTELAKKILLNLDYKVFVDIKTQERNI